MSSAPAVSSVVLPVVVEIDIPVTRRTKIHAVIDGDGTEIYHSRKISDVFDFLLENDVETFELLDDDSCYVVRLSRPPVSTPNRKGPTNG